MEKAFRKKVYIKFSSIFCLQLIMAAFMTITVKKAAFKQKSLEPLRRRNWTDSRWKGCLQQQGTAGICAGRLTPWWGISLHREMNTERRFISPRWFQNEKLHIIFHTLYVSELLVTSSCSYSGRAKHLMLRWISAIAHSQLFLTCSPGKLQNALSFLSFFSLHSTLC